MNLRQHNTGTFKFTCSAYSNRSNSKYLPFKSKEWRVKIFAMLFSTKHGIARGNNSPESYPSQLPKCISTLFRMVFAMFLLCNYSVPTKNTIVVFPLAALCWWKSFFVFNVVSYLFVWQCACQPNKSLWADLIHSTIISTCCKI